MKKVFTTGVFDILHAGHISLLLKASRLGDSLVVGVQSDESVLNQKGRYPTMSAKDRVETLKCLPFVSEVFIYSDVDQRANLEKYQPQVVVQGSDWCTGVDRTEIVAFLKKNKIDLEIIPYTKGISSTEIKRRIVESFNTNRDDFSVIMKRLQLVRIGDIQIYEKNNHNRTDRLFRKISTDKVFIDPILLANSNDKLILIDGANRIEALKEMGAKLALAYVVDYEDSSQVELAGNAHQLKISPEILLTSIRDKDYKVTQSSPEQVLAQIANGSAAAGIISGSIAYEIESPETTTDKVHLLNDLVKNYISSYEVTRLSEFATSTDGVTRVVFSRFLPAEIVEIIESGLYLESGITWHKVRNQVVRVHFPLDKLFSDDLSKEKRELADLISKKVKKQALRYYPHGVFLCDEW